MSVSREIGSSLGAYLKAQAVNAAVVIGLYMVAFAVTGVPWWALTGFIAGILNLVPYLGSLLALGLGVYLRWFTTDSWVPLAWVAAAWLLIQIVEGFVLSPRAAGRAGVNPFLSILITLAAGFMFGPIGVLLAVPVAAVLFIILRAMKKRPA